MIKFIGKNVFGFLLALVLIITNIAVFCLDEFMPGEKIQQNVTLASNAPDSKSLASKTPDSKAPAQNSQVNQPASAEAGVVDTQQEAVMSSYHSLDFIDDKNGWMIEDKYTTPVQPSKLLRTQDGGLHWEKAGIKDMTINKVKFINKTDGWAIAQSTGKTTSDTNINTMRILQTQDGGKSWAVQWEKKSAVSDNFDLWFQNTKSGYALLGGALLSTGDGGRHWSYAAFGIADFTPQHMSFANADKGWVIGIVKKNNPSGDNNQDVPTRLMVLQTSDGGRHWNRQFEKAYDYGPVGAADIDFVNASTGWFLTSDLATWNGELYYTSNGGVKWSKINQIKCVRPTPTELHFITAKIGWIPLDVGAGPIAGGLMFTEDGGKNFSVTGGEGDGEITSTSEVCFTSEHQGWAIGRNFNLGDYIIHTVDGGKTWTQIYSK